MFARWGRAAEGASGWESGRFLGRFVTRKDADMDIAMAAAFR
jgi:hypothetical protein